MPINSRVKCNIPATTSQHQHRRVKQLHLMFSYPFIYTWASPAFYYISHQTNTIMTIKWGRWSCRAVELQSCIPTHVIHSVMWQQWTGGGLKLLPIVVGQSARGLMQTEIYVRIQMPFPQSRNKNYEECSTNKIIKTENQKRRCEMPQRAYILLWKCFARLMRLSAN